jgi:methylase of polypeptide subunit release factors
MSDQLKKIQELEKQILQVVVTSKHTVINVGIGGSLSEVNYRFISYFIPLFWIAEKLLDQKISNFELRIFEGVQIANIVNSYDLEKLKERQRKNIRFISAFVDEFVPNIKDYLKFVDDLEYSYPSQQDILYLKEVILKKYPESQKYLEILTRWANSKNSNLDQQNLKNKAFFYAFTHCLFLKDFFDPKLTPTEKFGENVISLGGGAEKIFNYFREKISLELLKDSSLKFPTQNLRLIQPVGKYPPYYDTLYDQKIEKNLCFSDFVEFVKQKKESNGISAKFLILDLEIVYQFLQRNYKKEANTFLKKLWIVMTNYNLNELANIVPQVFPETKKYIFDFLNLKLIGYPKVYSPKYSNSTELFVPELLKLARNKIFLEVGSGTGAISVYLAKNGVKEFWATDIYDQCVENTNENFRRYNLSQNCLLADVYPNQFNKKFDLIFANLPSNIISEDISDKDYYLAMGADPFGKSLTKFITKSQKFLTSEGFLLLQFNHNKVENLPFLERVCHQNQKQIIILSTKIDTQENRFFSLLKIT